MDKTKVLKILLTFIISLLACVILSIPLIVKNNSKITEYQNQIQSMEQEVNQLKNNTTKEQINKSTKENNGVEEKSDNGKNEEIVEEKTEPVQKNDADKVQKTDSNTNTYQQGYKTNNTTVNTNTRASNTNKTYNSNTARTTSNIKNTSTTSYYILNKNTKKFHIPTCKSVKQMKDSNKISFNGTREEAISKGYSPCGNCNP